jgi:hypothetical protein
LGYRSAQINRERTNSARLDRMPGTAPRDNWHPDRRRRF